MNITESLAYFRDKLEYITEAFKGGHAPHPEDWVYMNGKKGAEDAKNAIISTIENPNDITIKWDGYPALIFGRGKDGKFIIADKHMFNKADGSGRNIHSPEEFRDYDLARGKDRSNLLDYITNIWGDLERASQGTKGYYWGDFLFSQPLTPTKEKIGNRVRDVYSFKANPNGVEYKIDVNSDLGRLITNKMAGVGVHMTLPADAAERAIKQQELENKLAEKEGRKAKKISPTDMSSSLGGTIGKLKNNTNVAILPSKLTQKTDLQVPTQALANVNKAIQAYGKTVDQFLSNAPIPVDAFRDNLLGVFINNKINTDDGTGRNLQSNLAQDFYDFAKQRNMPKSHKAALFTHVDPKTNQTVSGYLDNNIEGIQAFFMLWLAIYQLKMAVWQQLDQAEANSPVTGVLSDKTLGQEGYVSHGIKFVNRPKFSRLNAIGRMKK